MTDAQNQHSCNDVQFNVLLFGDEQSAEYRSSASHVEMCIHCLDRLAKFAAKDGDWKSVRTMLRSDRPDADSNLSGAKADFGLYLDPSSQPIKLDFLSPPSHPELLGRLDRYEIEQVIGRGGMGIVLKGFDTELNRPVAIKVLAPHLAYSGAARQRFAREARAAASIVHEHVVAIHDVKSEQDAPYLVMQYVHGRSLQERVEQEGPLAAAEVLRIGVQAAAGLAAAHAQGVIHRDVKPANILLADGVERAMLTDFGLARAADDATLTHSGIIAGTPHYMSPEQARGAPVDARSDLFSLGAVLYFMATGHPPFRADQAMAILHRICHDRHRPPQEVNSQIPDALADAIDRLLEKRPGRRFANAAEAQQFLGRSLALIQQPQPWNVRRWLKRLGRRRWHILAAACVLLALVVIGWRTGWIDKQFAAAPAENPAAKQESPVTTEAFAEQLRTEQSDFAKESLAIGQSLGRLENNLSTNSRADFSSDHSWSAELQAASAEAAHLEKVWSLESSESSSPKFLKGK